jgi:L-amino acid N-acyltransferase YncA
VVPLDIRIATKADASEVAAIYRPYVEQTVISFEVDPPDDVEMARRIGKTLETHPWLVGVEAGRVVGYAYATAHKTRAAYRWAADVSVYIQQDAHRRGLGRGLYTALFELLRTQGIVNAYAGITLPNPKSVGLHEALGFVVVGVYERVGFKFCAWHDVGWWQLALQPHSPAPAEPRRCQDVPDDDRRRAIEAGIAAIDARRR